MAFYEKKPKLHLKLVNYVFETQVYLKASLELLLLLTRVHAIGKPS